MEILDHIAVFVDGLLITLALVWIGWGLCHTIGVWPGRLERDLINDGDSDDGGEADAGGDSSGWDFGDWLDGLF